MERQKRLARAALMALTLVGVWGCPTAEPQGPGVEPGPSACARASDCKPGAQCVLGFCRAACPCPAGSECVEGLGCFASNCAETSCFGSDVCVDGKACGDPRCGGQSCGELACDAALGKCVTCTADKPCPTGQACAAGACVCNKTQATEDAQTCGDGVDNDCDGKSDCQDTDCGDRACGAAGASCGLNQDGQPACLCPGKEAQEVSCADGKDNDCDGKQDGEDPDCLGQVCRPEAAGGCDAEERWKAGADGKLVCPDDAFSGAERVCRPASDLCDVADTCDGTSAACPAFDAVAAKDTACRASRDVCDKADTCDGSHKYCYDAHHGPETECRGATGICFEAASCNGQDDACPANPPVPVSAHKLCRDSRNEAQCDAPEYCDGSGACQPDTFDPNAHSACTLAGAAQPVCCGASCADLKYDDNNCGGCGNVCTNGTACCDGACVDTQRDLYNCGGCGSYCGDSGYTDCVNGSCIQVPN